MNRRGFILGALAAPVVIRTPGLLMPVKPPWTPSAREWRHVGYVMNEYYTCIIVKQPNQEWRIASVGKALPAPSSPA